MSPSTSVRSSWSRRATNASWASCRGDASSSVTWAPAAARMGACWPPPPARQSTRASSRGANQSAGTGRVSVSRIDHEPARAAATTSDETTFVYGLEPSSTAASHAARLRFPTSMASSTITGDQRRPPAPATPTRLASSSALPELRAADRFTPRRPRPPATRAGLADVASLLDEAHRDRLGVPRRRLLRRPRDRRVGHDRL